MDTWSSMGERTPLPQVEEVFRVTTGRGRRCNESREEGRRSSRTTEDKEVRGHRSEEWSGEPREGRQKFEDGNGGISFRRELVVTEGKRRCENIKLRL